MKKTIYVQYGCGLSAPEEWQNFDVSPTLRIQKTPLIGKLIKNKLKVTFPENVLFGDIIKGLPIKDNSVDGIYCSHTLEHLSLNDFRKALKNTHRVMKNGATFRCIVPDLEWAARLYIQQLDSGNQKASIDFINSNTLLGMIERPKGVKGLIRAFLGNSRHLWMWDNMSLKFELEKIGFKNIQKCRYYDCKDKMFQLVENESRFKNAVAIQCQK